MKNKDENHMSKQWGSGDINPYSGIKAGHPSPQNDVSRGGRGKNRWWGEETRWGLGDKLPRAQGT